MKRVTPSELIRANRERAGIRNDKELSERIGLPYQTLRYRFKYPSTWKVFELQSLIRVTKMPDEDILELVKGK